MSIETSFLKFILTKETVLIAFLRQFYLRAAVPDRVDKKRLAFKLDIDRYHVMRPIPIFSKFFHRYLASCRYSGGHRYRYFQSFLPIFGQLPIFGWTSIPIFQNLLTDIFPIF